MSESNLEGVAIVGMHGRFPGASSIEAFWDNLVAGRESITFFSDSELASAGLDPEALREKGTYIPARGIIENADGFDAAFFGIHPKEAEIMDPQHRVFLEICWEALERTGYDPARIAGTVGIYAGATFNTYYLNALHPRPKLRELVGSDQVMMGNEKDYLATRVAYKLNLKGPAISLDTACSSSLVAVCQACQSLLTYQCDMTLAGGVSVRSPQQKGYYFQEGNIASPDGHTKTFDESAQGTVFSNGASLVVLKRLEDAVEDGDSIYAVIKGYGMNNDGSQRVSFGAPGVEGQSEVVSLAQAIAGIEPDSVSYMEAHGTATPLGDPIEVAALTKAFREHTNRKQFCAIGSVKTNIGHLDAAAGTAGLIKTALSLKNEILPPSLHFKRPNPKLDLENSPFFVNDALREWKTEGGVPRRAGVSSFGTGGTNAHVILEEPPQVEPSSPSRSWQTLLLSAKTPEALELATQNFAQFLSDNPDINLADAAFTLQTGRSEFAHRRSFICKDREDAIGLLAKPDPRRVFTSQQGSKSPPVVFMFPGQGSQYFGMCSELYSLEKVVRETVDDCARLLEPDLNEDLREIIFSGADPDAATEKLKQTKFTQPALFVVEYALARLWMSWGIKPAAMIGHSVGEYVAGCLAEVFSLEDALHLVAKRAQLVQSQPSGCMLAVRMSDEDIRPMINGSLSIAAVNAPKSCVISGPKESVLNFQERLASQKIDSLHLPTSHAFHSAMMDPVVEPFAELLRKTKLGSPKIPYVSNVTAKWITDQETTSPEYWAGHVRDTVRFADGISNLLEDSRYILLEVGPGRALSQLAKQHPERSKEQLVVPTLGTTNEPEGAAITTALSRLWGNGASVDWDAYYTDEKRHRIVLPTYPLVRTRFWPQSELEVTPTAETTLITPVCGVENEFEGTSQSISNTSPTDSEQATPAISTENRRESILNRLRSVMTELSGEDQSSMDAEASFFELGFDSLFLTQTSQGFRSEFGIKITFRQLMEDLYSLDTVADYLDGELPQELAAPQSQSTETPRGRQIEAEQPKTVDNSGLDLIAKQLELLTQQLNSMRGGKDLPGAKSTSGQQVVIAQPKEAKPSSNSATEKTSKSHGPFRPVNGKSLNALSQAQQEFLDKFIPQYTQRTASSKKLAETHRAYFADPRSVAGFRPFWKEMVYPVASSRTLGSRLWDVDGNEYVDFAMGFGTNLLGYSPPFVNEAVEKQLKLGVDVGPQSPLAGEVAALLCELTGMERAAFANTGSEAVLAAIRIARTVTGKNKIVYFTGDYHGICDEVLQRATQLDGGQRLMPVAPGIPPQPASNVMILEYGSKEALEIIRQQGSDLAAVIVEPVQSRHPDFQPREFLKELRDITLESETALIFDEVITGFRCHPGGVQALFGIKADIATYGKLIGGGMPIGALCGSATYMDALDGGNWNYGDDSFPEVGVTFFAGTYVRHPLAMAGALATLQHLKEHGPSLQHGLNERMTGLVDSLNQFLKEVNAPMKLEHFSSLFWIQFDSTAKLGSLIFFLLRQKGIHIFEGRLFFLSTAHSEEDLAKLITAFKESVLEMQEAEFLSGAPAQARPSVTETESPPKQHEIAVNAPRTQKAESVVISENSIASNISGKRPLDFSLYFFGNYPAEYSENKYKLILEGAKFADRNGFKSIWLPERHFHPVGGFSPNPAVIASALARETNSIELRAGSVVLPLHHPIRVAEEWAMVDNLSKGRVGISIASGWHPNDFVFAPDAFENRRELCGEHLEIIRKLWKGQAVNVNGGLGNELQVRLHPMPMQSELPVWLTCVAAASYEKAGEMGTGVLAMLTNQTIDEVAEKIALYREAYARYGHDPEKANVSLLVHSFVGPELEYARNIARKPMCDYLRSYLDNTKKREESRHGEVDVDQEDIDYLLERSFEDYANGKAFFGTPESCVSIANKLSEIGADEIGCFVDFGVDPDTALAHLPFLNELKDRCSPKAPPPGEPEFEESSETVRISTNGSIAVLQNGSQSGDRTFPLSQSQEGLWYISQLGKTASRSYHETTTLSVNGVLDVSSLGDALQKVLERHEGLRTKIDSFGNEQTVRENLVMDLPVVDLSSYSGSDQELQLQKCFQEFEAFEFDLTSGPIFRALLIKLAPEKHLLLLMCHHIFGNGPSFSVLWNDICDFYNASKSGIPAASTSVLQLHDFVDWSVKQAENSQASEDLAFWMDEFNEPSPALTLPTDRSHPSVKTYSGGAVTMRISSETTAIARKAGAKNRCSLFTTLLSAFQVLLHRLSGQSDVVVGVPFESEIRNNPGGDKLYANTTNVVPLRSRVEESTTFADCLTSNRKLVLSAHEHQNLFFGRLVQELKIPADISRSPLFSVLFNYESGGFKRSCSDIEFEQVSGDYPSGAPSDTSMFELYWNIADVDGELLLKCNYNSDLFDKQTIERWTHYFATLLESLADSSESNISKLPLLDDADRQQLMIDWNETAMEYPHQLCVHELIESQVKKNPDRVAIIFGEQQLTYELLNRRSNHLANILREKGIGPSDLAGVFLERSVDMVVALLAIWKAGGAYVPLDPSYPTERIQMILEDANPNLLLTQNSLKEHLPSSATSSICIDDLAFDPNGVSDSGPDQLAVPEDLAYVIFTSGSTGRPKGVEISHEALGNFLHSMKLEPGLCEDDVLLAVTTLSFDIAGLELWLPLICGARTVIAERKTAVDGRALIDIIEKQSITVLQATPITWHLLIESGWKGGKRLKALCGGEAFPPDLADELHSRCKEVWNMYGPTETTVWSTCEKLEKGEPITIGRPIGNTQIYIVNKQFEMQPVGVAGELLIGGKGLAKGYLNRPDLTEERFINNPFGMGRLYRTGDLAKRNDDGTIECLGRMDHQVKLRGFRIELGEIESALSEVSGIERSVVTLSNDKLVAYYVSKSNESIDISICREKLQRRLPSYMVPSIYVCIDEIPLTPNGKLDRDSLPSPSGDEAQVDRSYKKAESELESKLVEIWEKFLDRNQVGIDDNFFEIGGHSLIAARMFVSIEKEIGRLLPLATLFKAPTIRELAKILGNLDSTTRDWSSLVPINADGENPPLYFVHGAGGNVLLYRELASKLDPNQPVYGFQSQGLDGKSKPLSTIEEMAEHYLEELKTKTPEGPYLLAGYCLGGLVAYEMACRLRESGDSVSLLALLDTYNPVEAVTRGRFSTLIQRAKFHTGNLARLRPSELGSYVKEKIRVAKDGEFRNALGFGERQVTDANGSTSKTATSAHADLGIQKINDNAVGLFQPRVYDGHLTLFKPKVNYSMFPDPKMGWGELASDIEVVQLDMNPHAMLVEPYVEQLASELRLRIENPHEE